MVDCMNILHVISSFPPAYSYGGPAQQAYLMCRELVKRGHNVTVYTTDVLDSRSRMNQNSNPTIIEGIKVFRFKNISNNLAYKNFPCAPWMTIALWKNIKNYDIVHIHEYRTFQTIITYYHAKKFEVPYIFQARGDIDPIIRFQKIKVLFDKIWGSSICRNAKKCIPTAKIEAIQYREMGVSEKQIEIIQNAIDIDQYRKAPKYGEFRKKYSISSTEKIILSIGRIHVKKGLDLLIKSFAQIQEEIPHTLLVIVGPDEGFLSELDKLSKILTIQDKIIFTGPLYGEQKLMAYRDADVFVLPSKSENFGNVVIEALACGTPVIVTNLCGVAEWITDEIGYNINYDEQELSLALKNILSDDKKRIMMGENAIRYGENFSIKQTIIKFEKVYANAISEDTSNK
jgi:glycosyltransferase involved in cell wall biosynthesis